MSPTSARWVLPVVERMARLLLVAARPVASLPAQGTQGAQVAAAAAEGAAAMSATAAGASRLVPDRTVSPRGVASHFPVAFAVQSMRLARQALSLHSQRAGTSFPAALVRHPIDPLRFTRI